MNEPRTRPASRVICTTNALLPPPTASCCLRKLIVIFPCWCLELRATERVMKSDGIRRRTDASMVPVFVDAGLIRTSSLEYKFPVLELHLIISIFCNFTLPLHYIYCVRAKKKAHCVTFYNTSFHIVHMKFLCVSAVGFFVSELFLLYFYCRYNQDVLAARQRKKTHYWFVIEH